MLHKICSKCGWSYPATTEFFRLGIRYAGGLHSHCRECEREYGRRYSKAYYKTDAGKANRKRYYKTDKFKEKRQRYKNSLGGMLRDKYGDIINRCTNSNHPSYKNYGGRGIGNKFKSLDEFRNYCLKVFGKINYRELYIDRINNNDHYKPGNIRFVTITESLNNRREYKNAK